MAKVTKDDVLTAVQELEAAGANVSVAAVIGHLGRGSATTVTKLLREVREERSRVAELPPELDRNAPPTDLVTQLGEAAQAAALQLFKTLVTPINDQIQAAQERIERERSAMRQDIGNVLAEAGEARERAERLEGELHNAREAGAKIAGEVGAVREQLHARDETISALRSELQAAQGSLTDALNGRDRANVEADTLRAQLQQLLTDLGTLRATQETTQAKLEAAIAEAGELRGRLAAVQSPKK